MSIQASVLYYSKNIMHVKERERNCCAHAHTYLAGGEGAELKGGRRTREVVVRVVMALQENKKAKERSSCIVVSLAWRGDLQQS